MTSHPTSEHLNLDAVREEGAGVGDAAIETSSGVAQGVDLAEGTEVDVSVDVTGGSE